MIPLRYVTMIVLFASLPVSAEEFRLTSRVTQATLYPDGAMITREVAFDLPPGRHELVIPDLPQTADLTTLRVESPDLDVKSLRSRDRFVPPRDAAPSAEEEAARDALRQAEDALRTGEANVERIRFDAQAAQARLTYLASLAHRESLPEPAALTALLGLIDTETRSALEAEQTARLRAIEAEAGLDDLRQARDKAQQALDALISEDPTRSMVAVSVENATPVKGALQISYQTYAASWNPDDSFALDRTRKEVRLTQRARVSQTTGENWTGVQLALSTRRPTGQTTPADIQPLLRWLSDADVQPLKARADIAQEASGAVTMMAADSVIAEAESGGLAVTFQLADPVTLGTGADGEQVTLTTLTLPAAVQAQAVPLSDPHAYLVARLTLPSDTQVLPSESAGFHVDGRLAGIRPIEGFAGGSEITLGFGPIPGLQVSRVLTDKTQGSGGILTSSTEMRENVRIDVSNQTDEPWSLRILDRVPYSEQEALRIDWTATPSPDQKTVDDKPGVLAWDLDIPAGETQQISLRTTLKWPEGKHLR